MKPKELIKSTVVLTAICLIVAAALSATNYFTKDKIERSKAEATQAAMNELVPGAKFSEISEDSYSAEKDGDVCGYVFISEEMGYKSKIQVMTATDISGTVTGVCVTDCSNESPGIGQKVGTEDSFTDLFKGQSKIASADAITGATFSSDAVTKAVNNALEMYESVKGGQ